MAHVTAIDNPVVHALLAERKDGLVILALPGTDYRIHLAVASASEGLKHAELNRPITGRIFAQAKRVDVVTTGGRFIEPVYGRPRRIQGRIISTDETANTITLFCGCPFTCQLMAIQKASEFSVGQLVSFDVEKGARFEVESH
ncbi:MAG: hypothetical protein WD768_20515 [Phycisphaeraceae bacterium]